MNKLLIVLLSIIVLVSSCKKDDLLSQNNSEESVDKAAIPPYVWLIAYAIANVGEVLKGHYELVITYYPDGSIKSKREGCYDTIGTCERPTTVSLNGVNLLINDNNTRIEEYEASFQVNNAQIIVTTENQIVYAIDEVSFPEEAANFFYADEIEFSTDFIIDNPEVLEFLGQNPDEPIIQTKGVYQVYQNENYKFVFIRE
ncbi:MAG: hypothetical protein JXR34_05735 [Bacteroidales bacterium]|nr:hypothetical protein [Bacteroidales bacterium]